MEDTEVRQVIVTERRDGGGGMRKVKDMDIGKKGEWMQRANVWARALPHHRWAAGSTLDTLSSQSSPSLHASLLLPLPAISQYSPIYPQANPHSHLKQDM